MAAIRISKTRLKTLFCVGRIPKTNKLFLQNIHSNSQEIISSTSSPTMRLFDFLTCGLPKYNNRKREGLCFRVSNSKSAAPDKDIKQDGKANVQPMFVRRKTFVSRSLFILKMQSTLFQSIKWL
jgi:hypothetical protein